MKNTKTTFATFCETLSPPENELLEQFFSEFDTHFLVSKSNRKQFKADFEAVSSDGKTFGHGFDEKVIHLRVDVGIKAKGNAKGAQHKPHNEEKQPQLHYHAARRCQRGVENGDECTP